MARSVFASTSTFASASVFAAFRALTGVFALKRAEVELFHVETGTVSAAAAEVHAVRLVELTVITAMIALKIRVLHALNGQIQAPVLAIHRQVDVAAQRCIHAKRRHSLIRQVILHVRGVLDEVVQAQLIQAVIGAAGIVVIKLHFEAVTVAVKRGHRRKRRIALRANSRNLEHLAINRHRARGILLVLAGGDEGLPVIHLDIYFMDHRVVKDEVLVAHLHALVSRRPLRRKHEHGREQKRQHGSYRADNAYVLVSSHAPSPYSRRCS